MNYLENIERMTVLFSIMESLRNSENWCGETHVQKSTFFVDELTGRTLGYDFILYKHGPFSFELNKDLSVMNALRYVENEIINPQYGPRLRPNTEVREMLLRDFGARIEPAKPAITFVVDKLSDAGVATLERLGTALYFTTKENSGSLEQRVQRIRGAKSHVTETQAIDAVRRVDAILAEWEVRKRERQAAAH